MGRYFPTIILAYFLTACANNSADTFNSNQKKNSANSTTIKNDKMNLNNYTIADYQSIYLDMRRDADTLLKKAKEIKCAEAIEAATSALNLLDEANKQTDIKEAEMYYNEIQSELISGYECLDDLQNTDGLE